MVYAPLTAWAHKRGMTRFDKNFAALSHRMNGLSAPSGTGRGTIPIASLIDRVNAAKTRYQPR